jgi:hypothetical protein
MQGVALNAPDKSTFYTPGANGYTDYPTMTAEHHERAPVLHRLAHDLGVA